ncbi:MAG: hypothetical protein ACJ8EY_00555 [Sphingomicrobium sp.]
MFRTLLLMALLLAGCESPPTDDRQENATVEVEADRAPPPLQAQPSTPPAPGTGGGLPDDRTPLAEGTLDLKGPEGAGQVVQQFAALMEQRRFGEARKLWGSGGVTADSQQLLKLLEGYRELHAQVGKPSDMEGAAGSLYVTVPMVLYGRDSEGGDFDMKASATLRRVNDVPGSTPEQRIWHLTNIARA